MPKIGIRFDGFEDAPETFRVAALAEEAGATGLWMTEHIGYRESLVSCMAFAMKTKNAMVIPAAVTPYLFHPTPTAMALASMAEAFPGRVGVSVAIGNTLDMKESGKEPQDAVQTVEAYVRDLRGDVDGRAGAQRDRGLCARGRADVVQESTTDPDLRYGARQRSRDQGGRDRRWYADVGWVLDSVCRELPEAIP